MRTRTKSGLAAVVLCGLAVNLAGCSVEDVKSAQTSAQAQRAQKEAQVPICTRKLGTVAVEEAEDGRNWWTGQQLPSPTRLIKVFVAKSGCFTLLDRGVGMAAAMRERALASGGELRGGSNIGKAQVKAADYVLVPDLISSNKDAGGSAIGALVGGLIGGTAGALASHITLSSETADVVLTLTDVRSSEQAAMSEGNSRKTDLGFGVSGGFFGGGGLGGAGVGGYANTEIGQVITLAYLDAYTKMVTQLGGVSSNASQDSARQAVAISAPGHLLASASGGAVVRNLKAGATLYPTGGKQGAMWEVEDDLGNKGWINSSLLELSK